MIAGKHRIEGGEIAKRFLHHLRPRIHKDTMHSGNDVAELLRAARRQKQTQRKLTLGFLVQRPDDLAQVIDVVVGGFGSCTAVQ